MADDLRELITRNFGASSGELSIGGISVSRIVAQYGTPLFIYSGDMLDRKWTLLRKTLPNRFLIYYSVKANPNRAILKHFLRKGCGLEIASGGEFQQAMAAGCSPENIVFAGPGKTEAELELVLASRVGEIHAESPLEIERIAEISRRLAVRAYVALRVNPSGEAQGGAMRMGGRSTPFGIDEEALDLVLDRVLSDPAIEFRGIHLFTGTQILDYSVLLTQYRKGLEIAHRVANRLQGPLHTVDFGGGLGIPYFPGEQELDMEGLRDGLVKLLTEFTDEAFLAETQFIVEPGRYLVAEAGVYVARVNDIKVSRGKKYLVLDGGMNHHLAASGNLGQVIKRNFPMAILNRLDSKAQDAVDIVGPLCTPLDTLARDVWLPLCEPGDLVGVFQSGAYARTASPLSFLSHPTPPEVLVGGGVARLVRMRGTYEDLLRGFPEPT